MRESRFSKRRGYSSREKEITIREDAPEGLRNFILATIYDFEYKPSFLRQIICRVLRVSPDTGNWSERPNIAFEVEQLIEDCEWFYVYDIIELLYEKIEDKDQFEEEINDYFKSSGIGWKLEAGEIIFRGDEFFESTLATAEQALEQSGRKTAQNEIREAINDLSRKPHPDITGAIQHALACLECISREMTKDKKMTLGELIKKHRGIVPPPLDIVIEKAWGYSSEQGRHLQEGKEPEYDEAELLVGISASISTYLARKLGKITTDEDEF